MKRYFLLAISCLLTTAGAQLQAQRNLIGITDVRVEETGDSINVSFKVDIPRKTVKNNYTMALSPVITDDSYMLSLDPVIVQGRGAEIVRKRREMASGSNLAYPNAVFAKNGESVNYSMSVASQKWMQGAMLKLESVTFGCCSKLENEVEVLAQNIQIRGDETEYITVAVPSKGFVPKTLADTLSLEYPFVADISNFDPKEPFRIYDDERENALIVYYKQGGSVIDSNYKDNRQVLTDLTKVVNLIMNDPKSNVEKIIIAGFSSPEGNYELNDRLAFERAVAVKEHIINTTDMRNRDILIFNGSVDWRGLRYMLAKSNMPEKQEVIRIIDEVPIWDRANQRGRLGAIMKLNGGDTYRQLMKEYFPLMRNGAFIKVYYKNK